MARLELMVLGPFQVMLDAQPVTDFAYDKVRALLAYLAIESQRPHHRELLATLLWPNQSNALAHNNLRKALTRLRHAIHDHSAQPPFLLIDRKTIRFNRASDHQLDIAQFSAHIDQADTEQDSRRRIAHLERAVALYRGPALEQLNVHDSSEFEEWLLVTRERLYQRAIEAYDQLACYYEQQKQWKKMEYYVRQHLELDPWSEDGYRRLMRLLALCGQRGAALQQYEHCRQVLDKELGVAPEHATVALYEQIRAGQLALEDEREPPSSERFLSVF